MKKTMKTIAVFLSFSLLFISCSKQEDFREAEQEVINLENGLNFRKSSLKNQDVVFSLFDDEGNEIIENVTYFVNNTAIEGTTFQSAEEGEFEIYAEFTLNGETVATESETFSVITPVKKLMLEDYTGSWCGYCPAVSQAIKEVISQTSLISVVAIHNGDQFALPIEPNIREGLGIPTGSPRARMDRIITWGSAITFPVEDVLQNIGGDTDYVISINSVVENGTLIAQVSVAGQVDIQDKKLVVYLVEDNLVDDQTNYFNNDPNSIYFGMGDPIVDFEYDHVLRASISENILGDPIPTTAAFTDFVKDFSFDIPGNFVVENLHLVAILVDQDNLALNSQNAAVNELKPYE